MQAEIKHSPFVLFFSAWVIAYVLMYEPFFFVRHVRPTFRISIELLLLFTFFLIWISKTRPGFMPWGFLIFFLIVFWRLNSGSVVAVNDSGEHGLPGFITKIVFLVLGVNALQYVPPLVKFLSRAWVLLWIAVCIQVILAGMGYYVGLIDFPYWGTWEGGINDFYFNHIFGYTQFRVYFGFMFAKVSGYLLEPLPLGFFTGLNILAAPYFLSTRYAKKFKILNLVAGLFSGSVAFFLFLSLWGAYQFLEKHIPQKKKGLAFLLFAIVGLLVSWILLLKVGLGNYSSLGERAFRLSIGLYALAHSTVHALFFGNYFYGEMIGSDRGISCGLLNFFLQRGMILFIPVMYLFYKYTRRNFIIVVYLLYYSLLYEYFWFPAFIVFLVLFYSLSSKVVLPSPEPGRAAAWHAA